MRLRKSAGIALKSGMNVKKGETVLVFTDTELRRTGEAFREAAIGMGNETIYLEMIPREENGQDPPRPSSK